MTNAAREIGFLQGHRANPKLPQPALMSALGHFRRIGVLPTLAACRFAPKADMRELTATCLLSANGQEGAPSCPCRREQKHLSTEPGDCEKDEPNGPHNGVPPDRGVVPMFCRKPRLGKNPLTWSRLGGKAAQWRSRRLRQLGKSSQPIETKWADLAPVGKIAA